MEIKKNKELYDAPSMLVFEVKQEGVICASPGDRDNYIPTNDNPFA